MLALLGDAAAARRRPRLRCVTDVDFAAADWSKTEAGEEGYASPPVRSLSSAEPRPLRARGCVPRPCSAPPAVRRRHCHALWRLKFDTYFLLNQRGYASPREAALDGGIMPVSVYDSLIEAVHESLPSMRKYLELRRRAFKPLKNSRV